MRIERDAEHDLLYVQVADGEIAETVDLEEGVNLDVDASGRVLGVEFLAFERYMAERGGELKIPERVEAPATP